MTSNTHIAAETGERLAGAFLQDMATGASDDGHALFGIVASLAHPKSHVGDIALKALLYRVQKQLEAQR